MSCSLFRLDEICFQWFIQGTHTKAVNCFHESVHRMFFIVQDTHLNVISALESNIKQGASRSHLGKNILKMLGKLQRKHTWTEYDVGKFLGGYNL